MSKLTPKIHHRNEVLYHSFGNRNAELHACSASYVTEVEEGFKTFVMK